MRFIKRIIVLSLLLSSFNCFAMSHRAVDDPELLGVLYYTEAKLEQPVIVILGGSGGGYMGSLFFSLQTLVENGYAVLTLAYFDPTNTSKVIPNSLKRVPLEYFERAYNWVQNQPDLKKGTLAVYGTSRGGELALLLASKFNFIDLVVAGVPSSYVWGSFDENMTEEEYLEMIKTDPCQPAWTWQGKDVASICKRDSGKYDPWYDIIENTELVKDYLIPVENSSAAILLTSGTYDQIWPSTKMSEQIISRLESRKYAYPFKHIAYNAGHFIYNKSWNDVFNFIKLHYPGS